MSERKDLPEDQLGTARRSRSSSVVAVVRIAGVNRKEQRSASFAMAASAAS
ncbi:hypothetical protein HQN90_25530 [Paenibacillus alba]|nr:hypothetical protein [Paenibacillus alba]